MTNVQSEICNPKSLRVLIVEDSEDDALLLLNLLKRNGYEVTHERVEKEDAMRSALQEKPWDVILCDYKMPQFDGMRALKLVSDMGIDIPFIIVSGAIGEDIAVECMKAGAHDYIMKNKTQRFVPAVEREIREAAVRRGRKEIERELNNLAMVVKHSSELIYLAATDGTLVFMNEAGRDKIGIPFDQVAHHRILDVFPSNYRESVRRVILPELVKSGSWQGDLQYCNIETGVVIDVYASFFTIKDTSTGTSLYIANVSTDISERKKTEKEIMHLASFPQFSPILILEIERGGAITYVNPATQRALAEMGETDAALFIPRDIHAIAREGRISEEKEITREVVLHGRTYAEKFCFLPIFNAIMVYAYDITTGKRAEENLKRSEMHYRLIFENSGEAILLTDPDDGSVFSANPAACRMFQRTEAEICSVGRNGVIDATDPRLPAALEERERTGRFKGELTCLRADGRKFPCDLSSVIFRDQDGQLKTSMVIHDLTERKHIEELLIGKMKQFENMAKNVPGIIYKFAVRPDGSMTFPYISDNVRMIGLEPDEVTKDAHKLIGAISSDDLPGLMQSIDASARSLHTWQWEGRFIVSGEERWYRGISQPNRLADGTVEWDGFITDITEQRGAIKKLEELQRFSTSTIDALTAHVAVIDEEGTIIAVNRSWRDFAVSNPPVTQNVYEGANYLFVCNNAQGEDQEQARAFSEGIRAVIKGEKETFSLDYPCHSPDKKRWFTGRVTRFSDPGPIRVVVAHEDITDRKLAEEALQRSEEQYRNIFNDAILGIYQTTPEGRFLNANPALARMYGYSTPEELINSITDLATQSYVNHEDGKTFKEILTREGVVEKFETQLRTRSGETIWASTNAHTVKDAQGNIVCFEGTIENITERKRVEEAIRLSEERFKNLYQESPIPAFTWQKKGEDFILVDFNRAMIQVTNGKVGNYLGISAMALYKDRPDVLSDMGFCYREKSIVRREIVARDFVPGRLFSVFYGFIPPDSIIVYMEDITDKKRVEDALKKSEQKYRSIFENTIEGVFQSTIDGRFLTVNPAFAKMHGYESPDAMMKSITDIKKQLYADPVRRDKFTGALWEHGVITNFEHQQFKKDGNRIWVRINAREVRDDDNNILYYEGTAEDITERKNAEEALRESEEQFRQLAEQSLMAVGIIQDGVFKYFNRKFEEVGGYSADEIKGWKPFEFSDTFYPDDMNFVINQIKKKQAGYQDVIPHYYFRIIHKNGSIRWIEVYSKTVTYKDRPADMLTLIDITERKNAEKALRESEERYKTITEKTIAGIYLIQDGLLRYVNPTFCNIYGYTRDELVDKLSPLDLVLKEEKEFLNDKIRQHLSGEKESDQFSIRIRRKDGEIRFLEVFSSYALYAGKPAVLGTCVDMTEARRANEAIKRSQKELRSLTAYLQNVREEERIRIAREIHDELGQSLTGIKIDISWLKKKLGDIVEPTDPIQTKIDSILTLTESTISTTRELSLSLRPGILDDLGLVAAIKWQLKRFQEKVGIICMLQSDVAEITIPADYSTVLFRISQECLTNVSRHANATKVKITLMGEGKNLVLEIEDNGKGITKEQIKNPLSLGILGMRERIMGLKGRFSINGEPGKGTKVRVELPIK